MELHDYKYTPLTFNMETDTANSGYGACGTDLIESIARA